VAAWVREDIRDPSRLFLMGVLLHFNDDPDKSRTFFEAASALAPEPMYAQAFLEAEDRQHAAKPAEEPRPAPLDDEPGLAEPAKVGSARSGPANGLDGPRFPPAAALDDQRPRLDSPDRVAQPRQAAPGNGPGNGPGRGAGKGPVIVPRNAPGKVPEEPKPRPLASLGADVVCPGSWA
jgi:hypothetical protein